MWVVGLRERKEEGGGEGRRKGGEGSGRKGDGWEIGRERGKREG